MHPAVIWLFDHPGATAQAVSMAVGMSPGAARDAVRRAGALRRNPKKPYQWMMPLVSVTECEDIAMLVGEKIKSPSSRAYIIGRATQSERALFMEWAGAVHLSASDNVIHVPPRPKLANELFEEVI